MRLLVVSHLEHYLHQGKYLCGWPAMARELDCLAQEFGEVRHIACFNPNSPRTTATAYRSPHVEVLPVRQAGGPGWRGKLDSLSAMHGYFRLIRQEILTADALYIRSPANVAMAALAALASVRRKPPICWVKYAGEWRGRCNQPWSYSLQGAWLRMGLAGGFVTVNGDIAGEPAHVLSLPNPSFSTDERQTAEFLTRDKQLTGPVRLVFAGRLVADKGPLFAVQVCRALQSLGFTATLDLAGDGPERRNIEEFVLRQGMHGIRLHGWLDPSNLEQLWSQAHFAVLPSATEGWPKVLSEAMAYRTVPIATPVGAIPFILSGTEAGLVMPRSSPESWAVAIAEIANTGRWRRYADNAQSKSSDFSYETYIARLQSHLRPQRVAEALA